LILPRLTDWTLGEEVPFKVFGSVLVNPESGGHVSATGPQDIEFGPFRLDRRSRGLTRDGVPVSVGGRAFDILVALAAAAGETVGKAALLDQVWSGQSVEENNLQVHISALRKALGEGWIITVPGRGYRLLVSPRNVGPPTTSGSFDGKPSIAVLAFENMSGETDQEYFSDGVAEEIITALSRMRSFLVIARNSTFMY
jgi:DNA-binding winged helix-turn-helix (wHTH) protein